MPCFKDPKTCYTDNTFSKQHSAETLDAYIRVAKQTKDRQSDGQIVSVVQMEKAVFVEMGLKGSLEGWYRD